MKLATWNVNSLRVRLNHVTDWTRQNQCNVIALQETKLPNEAFPGDTLRQDGWQYIHSGQPAYNGVAILSREPFRDVSEGLPGMPDNQRRLIAATIGKLRIVNVYVPNGQAVGSEKYQYKLAWLDALSSYIRENLASNEYLAVVGDFNIAPEDRDVHDPEKWAGQVLVSEPEREAFRSLLDLGLVDSFRLHNPLDGFYSWWDYRGGAFRRNLGLRIDHILLSPALATHCKKVEIDRSPRAWERPSDHAPVLAQIDDI